MVKVQDAAKIAQAMSSDLSHGARFLEAQQSRAGVLCCAGDVQNREQHAGAGAAQPLVDPLQHMLIAVQI